MAKLLKNEKKVLYGLVRYPQFTDRQMAEKLNMKISTITAIRMKLARKNWYLTKRVPYLQNAGCEMLSIALALFSSRPITDSKVNEGRRILNREEFVYTISEPNQDFFIQFGRNLTDVRRNLEDVEQAYKSVSYLQDHITLINFPFGISKIPNYFEYAPILRDAFKDDLNLDDEEESSPSFQDMDEEELSNKEKTVFYGLVRHPDLSDIELSRKINASRMTIGKIRKKLEQDGMVRTINIPNLAQIGFELLEVTYGRFNLGLVEGLKYYVPDLLSKVGPSIFCAYNSRDIVFITVFRDFNQYKAATNAFTELYHEHEIFSETPKRLLFSLSNMRIPKNHEYAGFVKKSLGLEE